jgi:nucleoside-diphosphate-sugar epimerase
VKILLTGGTGFLGPHVLERLLARGPEVHVRCLVRGGSSRARIDEVLVRRPAAVEVIAGALTSPDAAAALLDGVDVVYHVAAALKGQPADMFLNTVVATKNLCEAAVSRPGRRPPRVVLVSSFSVYGVADLPRGIVLDETTPVETQPRRRDLYAQCKLRQEQVAWSYHRERQLPLTVLRPGVIYGPRGGALSSRVGLRMPGIFLFMGNDNLLPLSYVENCAEAIVHVGQSAAGTGEIFNVLDDELLTCRAFYERYRREVEPLRTLPLPYPVLRLASTLVERYHVHSRGQLPAVLTPYKVAAMWKGTRFSNAKLRATGWAPTVPTEEGVRRTFAYLSQERGPE